MTAILGRAARQETAASRACCARANIHDGGDGAPARQGLARPSGLPGSLRLGSRSGPVGSRSAGPAATCAGLALAHPDLGPRACKADLVRAPDQDDQRVFALIWNPEGLARPRLAPPVRGLWPTVHPAPPTQKAPALTRGG